MEEEEALALLQLLGSNTKKGQLYFRFSVVTYRGSCVASEGLTVAPCMAE